MSVPEREAAAKAADLGWKKYALEPRPETHARRAMEADEAAERIMRAAVRFVVASGRIDAHAQRDFGRALGADAMKGDLPLQATLEALPRLGVGHLSHEVIAHGRHRFASRDLPLPRLATRLPACSFVLGFVEGVTSAMSDEPAMGTETSCRATGALECVFVVGARHRAE